MDKKKWKQKHTKLVLLPETLRALKPTEFLQVCGGMPIEDTCDMGSCISR